MNSCRTYCALLAALLLACMPLAAQPTPNPPSVTIIYTGSAAANTVPVTISNATNVSARIDPNLSSTGTLISSSDPFTAVFTFNVVGNTINVGTNSVPLGALARLGTASYTGAKLLVSATGCTDCLTIPLTLSITGGGQLTVQYNGAAVPNNGVQIFASAGGSTTFQLTVTSTNPTGFTVSSNATWLIPSPASGTLQAGQSQTITFTALGSNLIGANSATVTFTSNSAVVATVPVVFNVGTGGLTLSPNPVNFQYATNTGSFSPGQTQYVTMSGPAVGATFSAQSNQNWLQVFNAQSVSGQSVLSQIPVSVNVAAALPFTGTLAGTISFQTSDGFTATLNVNLTISATGTGGGSTLNFSVPTPGGAAPAAQQFQITGTGVFSASAFQSTGTTVTWLSVSPTSGTLSSFPTTLTVSVSPGNLAAGTYSGSIFISTSGLLQNGTNSMTVPVTLTIGGGTTSGAVVSPTALVFTLPSGGSQQQSFIVNGDGTSFSVQSFAQGYIVSPTNGTTPAIVTVTATSSSSSSGSLLVTSSLGTQSVNLSLNMLGGNVLTATPASLAFINTSAANLNANLSINATGDATGNNLAFSVTSAPSFVSYSVTSATTPSAIGISIRGSSLGPGLNSGSLILSATSSSNPNNTLLIPITVLAPGSTVGFSATPATVSMTAQAFGSPVTTTVQVSGLAGTNFTVSTLGTWLTASPISGTSPATLTLTANPQGLGVSVYSGTVTVTGNNGAVLTIPVTLTTSTTAPTNAVLTVGTTALSFNYRKGDAAPAAQTVDVSASGIAVNFTASSDAGWITVTPASGATPATLSVSLNPALLSEGSQTGTITITAPGATGSPKTITVTANVTAPAVLSLSNSSANFVYRTGETNPAPQTIQVSSTGAALPFTVSVSGAPWLTVSPTSGTTPATLTLAVNPANLTVGQYSANVVLNSSGGNPSLGVVLTVSAPLPTVSEVLNGASNLSGPISPGLIIVMKGSALGPETLVPFNLNGNRLTTQLSSTRVLIGGLEAPIVYTSAAQVAAIVPYAMAGRASTIVQVEYLGQRSNATTVQVANTAPAVFTLNASGTGPGAILNQNNSVNSDANPAAVNSTIQVFATGEGQTIPAGVDGRLADNPNALPKPVLPVTATISGVPATVSYFGAAPGLVAGVLQVNIIVPPGASSGEVVLTIGNNSSQPGVTVSIR